MLHQKFYKNFKVHTQFSVVRKKIKVITKKATLKNRRDRKKCAPDSRIRKKNPEFRKKTRKSGPRRDPPETPENPRNRKKVLWGTRFLGKTTPRGPRKCPPGHRFRPDRLAHSPRGQLVEIWARIPRISRFSALFWGDPPHHRFSIKSTPASLALHFSASPSQFLNRRKLADPRAQHI